MATSQNKRVLVAYLAGAVTWPFVVSIMKPYLRSIAKSSIVGGLTIKKMIAETAKDVAAEALADSEADSGSSNRFMSRA